jgi:hypothetical protein
VTAVSVAEVGGDLYEIRADVVSAGAAELRFDELRFTGLDG